MMLVAWRRFDRLRQPGEKPAEDARREAPRLRRIALSWYKRFQEMQTNDVGYEQLDRRHIRGIDRLALNERREPRHDPLAEIGCGLFFVDRYFRDGLLKCRFDLRHSFWGPTPRVVRVGRRPRYSPL